MDKNYGQHFTESIPTSRGASNSDAKVGGKRKRMTGTPQRRHQRTEEVPWTAARCNRLLRTITSRIQILRRLSENNFADKAAAKQSPARRKIIFKPESIEGDRLSSRGVENVRLQLAALPALESPTKDGTDPEWFPDEGPKPSQRTYGGKGNKARKVRIEEPLRPVRSSSNADFHSPFIKRVLQAEAANSPINHITDTPRRLTSQRIVLDPKTHAERALRTLLDSFSTVLSTTASTPPGRKMGAGSLRNMCLRKVPDYMAYEQQDAYDEEEYDFDATETVYLHLEDKFGTGTGSGLRTVARAHAVKMIADAMDERSWPVESLDRLLDVCERNEAIEEGQQILRSWFLKAEGRAFNRVAKVLAWSKILDCTGFFFKTIRDMLESGCGRVDELLQCPGIWQDLLKALARRSTRTDAAEFLEAYTRACVESDKRQPDDVDRVRLHERLRRDEILQNIMVLVTALCWTVDDNLPSSTNKRQSLSSQVHRMAINICSHQVNQVSPNVLRGIEPLLTSSIVLYALNTDPEMDESELLPANRSSDAFVSEVIVLLQSSLDQGPRSVRTEFVCSTAKCIAHASQLSADSFIRDLSSSLLLLATPVFEEHARFFKQFAVNTAATWADYRADQASYVFADEIERAVHHESPAKELGYTPGSVPKPKVFVFEEAIGEWIATTPLASAKVDFESRKEDRAKLECEEEMKMEPVTSLTGSNQTTFGQDKVQGTHVQAEMEHSSTENSLMPEQPVLSSDQGSWPPSSSKDGEGLQMIGELIESAILSTSKSPKSVEESEESPSQAKALRSMPDRRQQRAFMERDELAATPYNKEPVEDRKPTSISSEDFLPAGTPAQALRHPPNQATLIFRPRPMTSQPTEEGTMLERDELAATPARPFLCHTAGLESDNYIVEQSTNPGVHEELIATPTKKPILSTRVLRSAKRGAVPPVQGYSAVLPRDELAMTPAHRVRLSPRKAKIASKPADQSLHIEEDGERDELTNTPVASRTLRSRPKQASKIKAGSKPQTAKLRDRNHSRSPTDATEKRTKLPLGVRSANIKTAVQVDKKDASDDELGL